MWMSKIGVGGDGDDDGGQREEPGVFKCFIRLSWVSLGPVRSACNAIKQRQLDQF